MKFQYADTYGSLRICNSDVFNVFHDDFMNKIIGLDAMFFDEANRLYFLLYSREIMIRSIA